MAFRRLGDYILRYLGLGGAQGDASNPLSVRGVGALFDGNTGGHQVRINKANAGNTASFLFQTGYSGRAEFGLVGTDDFELKVSEDGAAFIQSYVVDSASGDVDFKQGVKINGVYDYAYSSLALANHAMTGGGNITYSLSLKLKWTDRFLIISTGTGSTYGIDGYFQITMPPLGTIISAEGGLADVTVDADGIPVPSWGSVYYKLPIGAPGSTVLDNFAVATYNAGDFEADPAWVLIATRNNEANVLKLGTGHTLKPGDTFSAVNNVTTRPSNLTAIGIGATYDVNNPLTVSAGASLFNHAGSGHQVKVNKNMTTDTASFLFQTGFSGRAEIGTTGGDDFVFKTSPDGSTFVEALKISATGGYVTNPTLPAFCVRGLSGTSVAPLAPWSSDLENTGGHFNRSNGRFTAPVSGKYFFTCVLLKFDAGSVTSVVSQFRRNGVVIGGRSGYTTDTSYNNFITQQMMYLNAGDYVDIQLLEDTVWRGSDINTFSGWLIG